MVGKRYYITTLAAWQRHAPRCAEAHFITVDATESRAGSPCSSGPVCAEFAQTDLRSRVSAPFDAASGANTGEQQAQSNHGAALIFILVTADEGAHLAMENDAEFEVLPHPLARMPVSQRVSAALAQFSVAHGDDTFTVAEKLARANPLLRHRVF